MRKKRNRELVEIGVGDLCPRCAKPMTRLAHGPDWEPVPWRGHYRYWDRCKSCVDARQQYPVAAYVPPEGRAP